jgi:hypothetical protein
MPAARASEKCNQEVALARYRWANKAGAQRADGNATLLEFALTPRGTATMPVEMAGRRHFL